MQVVWALKNIQVYILIGLSSVNENTVYRINVHTSHNGHFMLIQIAAVASYWGHYVFRAPERSGYISPCHCFPPKCFFWNRVFPGLPCFIYSCHILSIPFFLPLSVLTFSGLNVLSQILFRSSGYIPSSFQSALAQLFLPWGQWYLASRKLARYYYYSKQSISEKQK